MAIDSEEKMSGAVLAAVAAAVGNLLQGWDNATIAGISGSSDLFEYHFQFWEFWNKQ